MSQPFPVADSQMLEIHVSEDLNMPVSDVQMVMVAHATNSQDLREFSMPDGQRRTESLVHSSSPVNSAKSNFQTTEMDPKLGFHESVQFVKSTHGFGEVGAYCSAPIPSLSSKRKAEVEPVNICSGSLLSPVPNKRVTQMLSISPPGGFIQPLGTNKKGEQMQCRLSSATMQNHTASKKIGTNDFAKLNSHRLQTPKGRTIPMTSTSKVTNGSSEAVRSKMRESLGAALELACPNQDSSANGEISKTQDTTDQISGMACPPQSDMSVSDVAFDKFEDVKNATSSGAANRPCDGQGSATLHPSVDNTVESDCFKDFQLANEDVSYTDNFFTKDELLQGNGLTWAWEMDMVSSGMDEVLSVANSEMVHEDGDGNKHDEVRKSPLDLAHEIEGELYKLYGGVNKKYKEKGRSLLFNLKDRNNPELCERVMAGAISPERLCSMTAEELASKELSEWRMAKAEELAQMVVLPDTDVNMRRLVRKTHKGEYEVEREDDISMDAKEEERSTLIPTDDDTKVKDAVPKSGQENHEISGRLIIPNEGSDLMQGIIVDEMKDADFLPPIVSLDEFMESLDSEPPFENLPVDAGQPKGLSKKENGETGDKVVTADVLSNVPVEDVSKKTYKEVEQCTAEKFKQSPVVQKIATSESMPPVEYLWQGSLQLSISSSVGVLGTFKSGERTSTNEWPASLEVKGRVRLDAFKKFLKDLPMSRSRSVMVVHFSLKDSALEDEKATLCEAVESYVSDERLGFAEPTSGVELYLCPPKSRIADMLIEHVSKDIAEMLNFTSNGLIGIAVWRKAHLSSSTISPDSSSHHKDGLKRQHTSARRQQVKDVNVSSNSMSKRPVAQPIPKPPPKVVDDDDDDIPPGFGPGVTRDDDDLPEFNFSGNVNHTAKPSMGCNVINLSRQPLLQRPVDHMRQLVQKYGQTMKTPSRDSGGVALGLEPWEDDEDDDIPEWRPQLPHQNYPLHQEQILSTVGQQYLQRNVVRPNLATPPQLQGGSQNIAPTWQRGPRYAQLGVSEHVSLGNLIVPGQQQVRLPAQGTHWRHDIPRSREL
ncbi:hypothetical protein Leryth_025988 [Lithospermum erythrorhizon]|nr:hypothetical protein Leryth_025988 [Lithospermum erythrorhizon]